MICGHKMVRNSNETVGNNDIIDFVHVTMADAMHQLNKIISKPAEYFNAECRPGQGTARTPDKSQRHTRTARDIPINPWKSRRKQGEQRKEQN
jgi:hypothetical protein